MKLGIIGLPQSGKTTIFNALTRGNTPTTASAGRFEVHTAVVEVPDPRVTTLSKMFNPKKTIYAKVTYADIAGLEAGSAKSGIATFLQGLRNRLAPLGVKVITVKLGFIDTRFVAGKKDMFLVASPEAAANFVVKTVNAGSDVVYFPRFWKYIMLIISVIPEAVFKRLKL